MTKISQGGGGQTFSFPCMLTSVLGFLEDIVHIHVFEKTWPYATIRVPASNLAPTKTTFF